MAAMCFDESGWLEQSWLKVTKETFLPDHINIGPVVSDKNIFKVSVSIYRENKPHPLLAMFFDES